jgi:hypothetical protein
MYNDPVETWEQDGVECNLFVDYNGDMFDPRDNDNLGFFVCREHRRYSLPQEINGFKFEDFDSIEEAIDYLKENHGAIHIYPVWMYDHSGVSYSMGKYSWPFNEMSGRDYPFNCPWDSSLCGLIFTTEERMDYLGIAERDPITIKKWLNGEIDEYSDWASGDVYYYTIDCPDGEGDGCAGLIGYKYAGEAAEEAFDFELGCYRERKAKEDSERAHWAARDVVTTA